MKRTRIIPRLDIKGDNLVKGVNLEGLRVLGKPEHFARLYSEEGADELLLVDVVASLYGRSTILEILERTAAEVFIPLTVAGGIRTLDDISAVLRSGADKVAINSAAASNPRFLGDAVQKFGSSTIVLSLEIGCPAPGKHEVLIEYGRQTTGKSLPEWIREASSFGIGEVLVTSVNHEGMRRGFNLELISACADAVQVPVIACGGAGSCEDVFQALDKGRAQAVSLASALHYHYFDSLKGAPADFLREGNTGFLFGQKRTAPPQGFSLPELRAHLLARGYAARGQKQA